MTPIAHRFAPLAALLFVALTTVACASGIRIDTDFEGSNIGAWTESEPGVLDMEIRSDTKNRAFRWYSFRVEGAKGERVRVNLTNARRSSANGAWPFNQPVVSADGGETWERVPDTEYEDGVFSFEHDVASDSEWFALLYPYSFDRWLKLVASIQDDPRVAFVHEAAKSLEGRPVHLLGFTAPGTEHQDKPSIWITSRVHPAETGSSWKLEGLIEWLLGDDPQAAAVLEECTFYVVGVLNPDGVVLGNYRMDTLGQNLNREWNVEDESKVPTLMGAKKAMRDYVDGGGEIVAFYDLHCFSSIRANFVFYNDESNDIPAEQVLDLFDWMELYERVNPDFSVAYSDGSEASNPGIAKSWVFNEFGVPALTYETSYQDIRHGAGGYMTIPRYKELGADLGRVIGQHYFDVPMTAAPEPMPAEESIHQ